MAQKGFGGVIESVVDGIFSLIYDKEKKYERWLLLLFVIGFCLRFIAAIHEGFFADDAIYASQSAGIIGAKLLSTHSHPALFSYLTDTAYKVFGYTTLAARFFPLIAGTLLILVSYLLGKKLFNAKVGLAAAFFVTFSDFLVRMTFTEHTLVTLFFVALGTYCGLLYLDQRKMSLLVITAIIFGLGDLTKYNSPFFILAFLVFAVYYFKSNNMIVLSKKNVKHFVVFIAILILMALPFLAFNYFIYSQKGLVDFQFDRIFKPANAQQLYGSLAGQDKSFVQSLLTPSVYSNYGLTFTTDWLMTIFALAGLFLMFRRKLKPQLYFILITLLIPFILQSAGSGLQKHFAFMQFTLAIPAGYALIACFQKINKKWINFGLLTIITLLLIINLGVAVGVPQTYLTPSGDSQLKSYINGNVKNPDLIIFDARIYTALTFWFATDHSFLSSSDFVPFYQYNQNISDSQKVLTDVYFVECAIDDCGWGWVSQNQNFNQTTENFFDSVKNQTLLVASLEERKYSGNEFLTKPEVNDEFRVYKARMLLAPQLVEQTKSINSFYFVPYLYVNMKDYVFNYTTIGLDSLLNMLSLWIVYISLVLAVVLMLLTPFIVILSLEKLIKLVV